ncbi:hypothetical protein [Luteolibacter sp. AS25]|uniref:hypothetical protein n=1 Tax=Luteolibacter sp. AS25 TaxID=3135776 RepID=UPI00398A7425
MSKIPSILEQELRNLKPCGIDDDFLERLVSCAEGTDSVLSAEELGFASELRARAPRNLPATLEAGLMEAIGDTPFHMDEKIVLFNKSNKNSAKPKRSNIMRFNFAAAAAVALMGSIAAFMIPGGGEGENRIAETVDDQVIETPAQISPVAASNFAPVGLNRNLSETHDEGVMWGNDEQPHRVMRMTYLDRVTLSNDKGETIEVSQPKVEYVVMPEKID